jgi:hypothetical protein
MPAQCPLCRQPLPEGINESELQARIQRLGMTAGVRLLVSAL